MSRLDEFAQTQGGTKCWVEKNLSEDERQQILDGLGVYSVPMIARWVRDDLGHVDATPARIRYWLGSRNL